MRNIATAWAIITLLWRRDREAEGAPLLREYAVMSCIKGSNPFVSAKPNKDAPYGAFFIAVFNINASLLPLQNQIILHILLTSSSPFTEHEGAA